jgi:hypothetical protein
LLLEERSKREASYELRPAWNNEIASSCRGYTHLQEETKKRHKGRGKIAKMR